VGLAVFAGIYVAFRSGGTSIPPTPSRSGSSEDHLHPVVGLLRGRTHRAFIGAVIAWVAFKEHFDAEEDAGRSWPSSPRVRRSATMHGTPSPSHRHLLLIFVILISGGTTTSISGGRCSWGCWWSASAPRSVDHRLRDQPGPRSRPRIAHFILPIKGKGGSDWGYAWVRWSVDDRRRLGTWAFLALGGTGMFPGVV